MIGYGILFVVGHVRDLMRKLGLESSKVPAEAEDQRDFVPLYRSFESFYTRNLYRRIRDCWNHPISSTPGSHFDVVERVSDDYGWSFKHTGKATNYLNLSSYNYLGFAENAGPCLEQAVESLREYGTSACGPRAELGTQRVHRELENIVAE